MADRERARFLRDTLPTIYVEIYGDDGELIDPDNIATVTCTVADSAGVAVGGTLAATKVSTGLFKATLAAPVATLDTYDVTWSFTLAANAQKRYTQFEIAGSFFFSVPDLRNYGRKELADTALYPAAEMQALRVEVEDDLEQACGVAFVPRARRLIVDGTGATEIWVDRREVRSVVSVSVDGTAFSAGDLADIEKLPGGILRRKQNGVWNLGRGNISILFTHGKDKAPGRIRRAALMLAYDRAAPNPISPRTLSHTDAAGTRQFAVASATRFFGIPEVDAAVERYSELPPAVH